MVPKLECIPQIPPTVGGLVRHPVPGPPPPPPPARRARGEGVSWPSKRVLIAPGTLLQMESKGQEGRNILEVRVEEVGVRPSVKEAMVRMCREKGSGGWKRQRGGDSRWLS